MAKRFNHTVTESLTIMSRLTIRDSLTLERRTSLSREAAAELTGTRVFPVESGWGVFEHHEGTSCMPSAELRNVHPETEKDRADREAAGLNATEGVVDRPYDDPECPPDKEVFFRVGHVGCSRVAYELVVNAQYQVDNEQNK